MPSLSIGDQYQVLDLVAEALNCAGPDFPNMAVTKFLCRVFEADYAGAGEIDLVGAASRRWAAAPHSLPLGGQSFHDVVVDHPLTRAYRRIHMPCPLRFSDVKDSSGGGPVHGDPRISRLLTVPMLQTPRYLCAIALMRMDSSPDFTSRALELASRLQPVLGGIYTLRTRLADPSAGHDHHYDRDAGVSLTAREVAVLDLLADGLIAAAIARRLGISPRTVSKHTQNIYRKLGSHDRISAVLRAQARGLLPAPRW